QPATRARLRTEEEVLLVGARRYRAALRRPHPRTGHGSCLLRGRAAARSRAWGRPPNRRDARRGARLDQRALVGVLARTIEPRDRAARPRRAAAEGVRCGAALMREP